MAAITVGVVAVGFVALLVARGPGEATVTPTSFAGEATDGTPLDANRVRVEFTVTNTGPVAGGGVASFPAAIRPIRSTKARRR